MAELEFNPQIYDQPQNQHTTTHNHRLERLAYIAIVGLFTLPILITAFNARYSRMVADDYPRVNIAQSEGVWGTVVYYYNNWSGNYSSSLLHGAATLAGPSALGWMITIMIAVWWFGVWWLAYEVARRMQWPSPRWTSLFVSSLIFVTVIDGLPNIYDTLYWSAGAVAHVTPLIGVTYYFAFLLFFARVQPKSVFVIIASLLVMPYIFWVGGYSVPSTAHFITLTVFSIVLFWRFAEVAERRVALPILMVGLVTAFIAIVVIASSPGTDVRQSRFPPTPGLTGLVQQTALYTAGFVSAELVILAPFSLLLTLCSMGWLGYQMHQGSRAVVRRYRWVLMGGVLVAGILLIAAAFSTGAYAMSTYLASRANTTPVFTLTVVVAIIGYVMGATLRGAGQGAISRQKANPMLVLGFVVLIGLGPVATLLDGLTESTNMAMFKNDWERIHQELLDAAARGETDVVVDGPRFDLGQVAVNSPFRTGGDLPQNPDLLEYYGLESVVMLER